jgi:hypothetical protein
MNYPHKDDADIAALDRLPGTAYATDDKPFLATQRYSLSADYEFDDVSAKVRVDMQGCLDNQYWMAVWKAACVE